MASTLYRDNDNDIYISGFRKRTTGEYRNDATFTFTAYNVASGVVISNGSGVSIPYVSGSNGNYSGILPGTLLTAGEDVKVVVTSSNYNVALVKTFTVEERSS